MWDYCLFLGKFTDSKGRNYDLGVCYNGRGYISLFSDATVFDNQEGSYSSGLMNYETIAIVNGTKETKLEWYKRFGFEAQVECWNRLQELLKTIDKI